MLGATIYSGSAVFMKPHAYDDLTGYCVKCGQHRGQHWMDLVQVCKAGPNVTGITHLIMRREMTKYRNWIELVGGDLIT